MKYPTFSVVIATYNRLPLLLRAINSVKSQTESEIEIVVVDDCSSEDISSLKSVYPDVIILRQEKNMGPGSARNRGIKEASGDFIIILDDDDELLPAAVKDISQYVIKFIEYPVIQFAHSNGKVKCEGIVDLKSYLMGDVVGDFSPVINRSLFLQADLSYPKSRVGGEHLLWWRVSKDWGIPTFSLEIMKLNVDAQIRLTSTDVQIRKASDHFELAERTLDEFGDVIVRINVKFYNKKNLGAIAYAVLSNNRSMGFKNLWNIFKTFQFKDLLIGMAILATPRFIVVKLFRRFRH